MRDSARGTPYPLTPRAPLSASATSLPRPGGTMAHASAGAIVARNTDVEGVHSPTWYCRRRPDRVLLQRLHARRRRMWRPSFRLSRRALPGDQPRYRREIGDSAIPADGLEMKTASRRIHRSARSSASIRRACRRLHRLDGRLRTPKRSAFSPRTEKLVLMTLLLPGVAGGRRVRRSHTCHFSFLTVRHLKRLVPDAGNVFRLLLERSRRGQDSSASDADRTA